MHFNHRSRGVKVFMDRKRIAKLGIIEPRSRLVDTYKKSVLDNLKAITLHQLSSYPWRDPRASLLQKISCLWCADLALWRKIFRTIQLWVNKNCHVLPFYSMRMRSAHSISCKTAENSHITARTFVVAHLICYSLHYISLYEGWCDSSI